MNTREELDYSRVFNKGQALIEYVDKNLSHLPKELVELVGDYFNELNDYNKHSQKFIVNQVEESKKQLRREALFLENPSLNKQKELHFEWRYSRLETLINIEIISPEKSPGIISLLKIDEDNEDYSVEYKGLVHDCQQKSPWVEFTEISLTFFGEIDNSFCRQDIDSLVIDFEEISIFYKYKIIEEPKSRLTKRFLIKLELLKA